MPQWAKRVNVKDEVRSRKIGYKEKVNSECLLSGWHIISSSLHVTKNERI